jgi:dTDP-4-dehydrorhamnose reductase
LQIEYRDVNVENNKRRKILLTGANGQLGAEFVRLFSARDIPHLALGREQLDISDLKTVRDAVGQYRPGLIINCAAYNLVDAAEKDPAWKTAFSVNGIGVKNLALAAADAGSELVHFSTDYVFDGTKPSPYTIADPVNPVNMYGRSKLLGEESLRSSGCSRYYLVRTSWVFGFGKNSALLKILDLLERNDTVRMVSDQVSSPTYAEDLARAALDLAGTRNYGLYHITNGGACSRYEWAEFICRKVGLSPEKKLGPALSSAFKGGARRPAFSAMDNFPLEETIGYLLPDWKDASERFLRRKDSRK